MPIPGKRRFPLPAGLRTDAASSPLEARLDQELGWASLHSTGSSYHPTLASVGRGGSSIPLPAICPDLPQTRPELVDMCEFVLDQSLSIADGVVWVQWRGLPLSIGATFQGQAGRGRTLRRIGTSRNLTLAQHSRSRGPSLPSNHILLAQMGRLLDGVRSRVGSGVPSPSESSRMHAHRFETS